MMKAQPKVVRPTKEKIARVVVTYKSPRNKILIQKTLTPGQYQKLYNQTRQRAKKTIHAQVMLHPENPIDENKKLAAAEHGALFDPLHVQNQYRHDELDIIIVEKDYHSGAKYIRQLDPQSGKTIDFLYETYRGSVFYQRYLPEPRMRVYHNKETGKKVTTYRKNGRWGGPQRVEWLKPEGRAAREPHYKNKGGKKVTTINGRTGEKTVTIIEPKEKTPEDTGSEEDS